VDDALLLRVNRAFALFLAIVRAASATKPPARACLNALPWREGASDVAFFRFDPSTVMPGLVPGIHARTFPGVDGRDKPGHDG